MPQLKAAIQRKRRNFSREPIGPIGAELVSSATTPDVVEGTHSFAPHCGSSSRLMLAQASVKLCFWLLQSLTDDKWKIPVEECAGKVFNNFIVNNFEDMRLLKQCAKDANTYVNVVIYNFDHAP